MERVLKVDQSTQPLLFRIGVRTCLVLVTLGLGELVRRAHKQWGIAGAALTPPQIKNFGDFLDLVSAVTNSFTSFILPCVFFLRLFWKDVSWPLFAWNVLIICAALGGFVFGGYDALAAVLCDITDGSVSIFPKNLGGCSASPNATTYPSCF